MPGTTNFSGLRYSLQTESASAQTGFSNLANDLDFSNIKKFANRTARDTATTAAGAVPDGTICYISDIGVYDQRVGGAWKLYGRYKKGNTADLTYSANSTTFADATGFSWAVESGGRYHVEGHIRCTEPSGQNSDIKFQWTYPTLGGPTSSWSIAAIGTLQWSSPISISLGAFPTLYVFNLYGYFGVSASGTLQLQWAKDTATTGNLALNAGTWISVSQL